MAIEKRNKVFLYKCAEWAHHMDGETLESVLKKAMAIAPKPMKRRHNPSGDNETFQFINYSKVAKPATGGSIFANEFLSYLKGGDQSTLQIDEEADEVPVSALEPDPGQEYLEGNLYFGVLDNHLVVMQSSALRTAELEAHLNWLLVEHTEAIHAENRVLLVDSEPDVSSAQRSAKDVKSLSISAPVQWESKKSASGPQITIQPKGNVWEAIRGFFDLPNDFDASALIDHKLKAELKLRWERGSTDDDAQDFMSSMARQLRHVEDEVDFQIHTKHGVIGKDQFKLRKPLSVPWKEGRPRFDDVFPKMLSWLSELQTAGRIRL